MCEPVHDACGGRIETEDERIGEVGLIGVEQAVSPLLAELRTGAIACLVDHVQELCLAGVGVRDVAVDAAVDDAAVDTVTMVDVAAKLASLAEAICPTETLNEHSLGGRTRIHAGVTCLVGVADLEGGTKLASDKGCAFTTIFTDNSRRGSSADWDALRLMHGVSDSEPPLTGDVIPRQTGDGTYEEVAPTNGFAAVLIVGEDPRDMPILSTLGDRARKRGALPVFASREGNPTRKEPCNCRDCVLNS